MKESETLGKTKKLRSHWNERWTKVETKHPTMRCDYYISDYGRIKSVEKVTEIERELKGSMNRKYNLRTLNLRLKDEIRQSFYVHHIVAKAFLVKPSEAHKFVLHLDGDNQNNYWENLKWVTQEELSAHYREKGSYKGLPPANPKLKESEVKIIRKYLQSGTTRRKVIAKRFNISMTQLRRIESGENWGNLK